MPLSMKQAFSVLEGWADNKTALLLIGMRPRKVRFGPPLSVTVLKVDSAANKAVVLAESPEGKPCEIPLDLKGALFEFGMNAADESRATSFLHVRVSPEEILLFTEVFGTI